MNARQASLKRNDAPEPASTDASSRTAAPANVEGNARLTGSFAAVIFGLLAIEGVTILRVHRLLSWHVFVGMLLVPFAAVKIASTSYRFARYYTGRDAYVRKGPPHFVLRVLGPFVTVLTVAVLATGIAAMFEPHSGFLVRAHKASFILWFGAMAVHVLGHALETPALAFADWRRRERGAAAGASMRLAVLGLAVAVGVPLAMWSLHYAHAFQRVHPG